MPTWIVQLTELLALPASLIDDLETINLTVLSLERPPPDGCDD